MKDIFIKTSEFYDSELEKINRYAYRDYRTQDIISVEELVVTIQELLGKCEELEEELKHEDEAPEVEYSDWVIDHE